MKIVILTDARAVLVALQSPKNTDTEDLNQVLTELKEKAKVLKLQWIPGHCQVHGNEVADSLAKEGSSYEQIEEDLTLEESKTIIKDNRTEKWRKAQPGSNKSNPYFLLDRRSPTILFRLRTGHNRLSSHMHRKFNIGESGTCPCGEAPETTEHVLQACVKHKDARAAVWPAETTLKTKLYGSKQDLRNTIEFINITGLLV